MDYKQLLIKYINHVIDEESICYLEGLVDTMPNSYHRPADATDEDVVELIAIRDEILAKRLEEYNNWKAKVK